MDLVVFCLATGKYGIYRNYYPLDFDFMHPYCFLASKNNRWGFINALLGMGWLCVSAYICNLEIESSYFILSRE